MRQGRVVCLKCQRVINGRIPRGGDGGVLYPFRHKRFTQRLVGEKYCPGSDLPARPYGRKVAMAPEQPTKEATEPAT